MNVSAYAYIHAGTGVTVTRHKDGAGRHARLEAGDLTAFIYSREKLLELVSQLEKAAQEWEENSDLSN